VPGQIARQRMQPPTGHVHVLRRLGLLQLSQLPAKLRRMGRLYAGFRTRAEKGFEALVSEAADHWCECIALRYGNQAAGGVSTGVVCCEACCGRIEFGAWASASASAARPIWPATA